METNTIDLIVYASVDKAGPAVALPGHSYQVQIFRYKVIKILKGVYDQAFILVGHDWADPNSPHLQPGVKIELKLSLQFPQQATFSNSFINENPESGIFYCVSFQLMD